MQRGINTGRANYPLHKYISQISMSSVFFYEPFYNFDRLFDEAFNHRQSHKASSLTQQGAEGTLRPFKPRMDLHEDSEKNLVTAAFELPGVSKENIQIEIHSGKLTVSAETKLSTEHAENGYAIRERQFGKYSRTLQLPQGVKDEEITAAMENGVLKLTFPRTTPDLVPKRITIS